MAEDHPWLRLDLEVRERGSLALREAPDLARGEVDVPLQLRIDGRDGALDRLRVDPEGGRIPTIEPAAVLADRVDPVALHGVEDRGHGVAHGRCVLAGDVWR